MNAWWAWMRVISYDINVDASRYQCTNWLGTDMYKINLHLLKNFSLKFLIFCLEVALEHCRKKWQCSQTPENFSFFITTFVDFVKSSNFFLLDLTSCLSDQCWLSLPASSILQGLEHCHKHVSHQEAGTEGRMHAQISILQFINET